MRIYGAAEKFNRFPAFGDREPCDMPCVFLSLLSMRIRIDECRKHLGLFLLAPMPSRRIFFNPVEMAKYSEFAREHEKRQRSKPYGSEMSPFADGWKFETVEEMRSHYG